MNIAISTYGDSLDSNFDSRFGRAKKFCVLDTETKEFKVIENSAFAASGGAGVEAAQLLSKHGAQVIISGAFGPNAYNTLASAEIKMFLAPGDQDFKVSEIVEMFIADKLLQTKEPTHKGHHGRFN